MADPFDHHHGHDHGHDHDHDEAQAPRSLAVIEEPLDPANQSLADALRASFRVLKVIMIVVVACFLGSGFYIVDQNEVAVLTRFGRLSGDLRKPGFHVAFPYPIDQKTRVPTYTKELEVRSFWMRLAKDEETRPLSQLFASRQYLEPGVDGALLTAVDPGTGPRGQGGELVHVLWKLTYRITDPLAYVQNVEDERATIESLFDAASVAMAARSTVDNIAFTDQSAFRALVQEDAQRRLDEIRSGIRIERLNSTPYQPLQVRDEFNAVVSAQNRKQSAIKAAEQERDKILNETAGEAHGVITDAIREYERARLARQPEAELERLEAHINELLLTKARGSAADVVKTALAQRDQIVRQARADADTLRELKPKYDRNPTLLRDRMWQQTQREIYASNGVTRFFLPDGVRQFVMWLNRDPVQQKEMLDRQLKPETNRP